MRPAILYILGAGRSGSTMLERLLGSAPAAVGVGELHVLWRLPFEGLSCACGAPAPECGFWREVRRAAGLGDARLAELRGQERRAIRHSRLALAGAGAHRRRLLRHLALQRRLFAAIAEVAQARLVIDSSKAAPRAWALSALPEARILHLRRHPGAVIAAWRRGKHDPALGGPMRRPPALAAGADWLRAEISARALARRRPVWRIDYEALAADPEGAVAPLGPLARDLAWTGPRRFRPAPEYHALSGNPDRFRTGEIEIRAPAPPALGPLDRAAAALLGGALARVAP